jgi:hypothetical protein
MTGFRVRELLAISAPQDQVGSCPFCQQRRTHEHRQCKQHEDNDLWHGMTDLEKVRRAGPRRPEVLTRLTRLITNCRIASH